jgi:uncharacterized membrane protein YbhN (UPF0104 family)
LADIRPTAHTGRKLMGEDPLLLARPALTSRRSHRISTAGRIAVGVAVLAALFYWGALDFSVLGSLVRAPAAVVASAALILLTLPLFTWRWAIVLRALDLAVSFGPLFRILCLSLFIGQFLFGPASADAARGIYAWRLLRQGAGRIAVSILVDRAVGLLALIVLAATTVVMRWERVLEVPELRLLALSLATCLATAVIGGAVLLAFPRLWNVPGLGRFPRTERRLSQVKDVLIAMRKKPGALCAVFILSLIGQGAAILALGVLAAALHIGSVAPVDVSAAGLLAMVASILPFTPGGLGVAEAAFDQLCRLLASAPDPAPYASIFFAFRAVSMVVTILGASSVIVEKGGLRRSYSGELTKD